MRTTYGILFSLLLVFFGCQWRLKPADARSETGGVTIERYDRIESLYLTTGDYSALQQMNTVYPMQTRTLIEDVLHIGKVNDPSIHAKFLSYYQDSTLQAAIAAVDEQYADLQDLNEELTAAFERLKQELPTVTIPDIYAQIGSFDQSIIVGSHSLGISLDKYLGADYPFYQSHYPEHERRMMVRSMIVPDCLGFYILSLFPMPADHALTQQERDRHMGKIQWLVNRVTGRRTFSNPMVTSVERYMRQNRRQTAEQLLLGTLP